MWMILQQDKPDDYVFGTGETHSVRELVIKAFSYVDITIEWQGSGINEKGIDSATGEVMVEIDAAYFRPTEVDILLSNPTKAREKLGWVAEISFDELIQEMVKSDLVLVESEYRKSNTHD
jgi:GDPmannose 4,6-dehydratase